MQKLLFVLILCCVTCLCSCLFNVSCDVFGLRGGRGVKCSWLIQTWFPIYILNFWQQLMIFHQSRLLMNPKTQLYLSLWLLSNVYVAKSAKAKVLIKRHVSQELNIKLLFKMYTLYYHWYLKRIVKWFCPKQWNLLELNTCSVKDHPSLLLKFCENFFSIH